jgi:hypothetical protein
VQNQAKKKSFEKKSSLYKEKEGISIGFKTPDRLDRCVSSKGAYEEN